MKNRCILILALILTTLTSCSTNLTKNSVQEGTFLLRNGTFSDKVWRENLVFQRNSWYHELTMTFDLMMAQVTPQSAFNFWFSKEELESMISCADSRVVMAYSLDTKSIPYSSLYEQLEKSGYTRIDLLNFKKHLLQHPDAEVSAFRLYHIFGICKKAKDAKPLIINYPGYLEKSIN